MYAYITNKNPHTEQRMAELTREIKSLEREIKYQKNILSHRSVPSQYQPKNLPRTDKENEELNDRFLEEYNIIFLEHLKRIIEANSIVLTVKKARLQSTFDTGHHHQPKPTLQTSSKPKEILTTQITTSTPQHTRKRKQPNSHHNPPTKQRRLTNFLGIGHHNPPNIT